MMTLRGLHQLAPCAFCAVRMAVPGDAVCTICQAVTLPGLVPHDLSALECTQ
jgi:hypothetical protein